MVGKLLARHCRIVAELVHVLSGVGRCWPKVSNVRPKLGHIANARPEWAKLLAQVGQCRSSLGRLSVPQLGGNCGARRDRLGEAFGDVWRESVRQRSGKGVSLPCSASPQTPASQRRVDPLRPAAHRAPPPQSRLPGAQGDICIYIYMCTCLFSFICRYMRMYMCGGDALAAGAVVPRACGGFASGVCVVQVATRRLPLPCAAMAAEAFCAAAHARQGTCAAAVLKTLLNGWDTTARMHDLDSLGCVSCGLVGLDSLGHCVRLLPVAGRDAFCFVERVAPFVCRWRPFRDRGGS